MGVSQWRFRLNTTHPAYKIAEDYDEDRKRDYAFEEMVRQVIHALLKSGRNDVIKRLAGLAPTAAIENLDAEQIVEGIAFRTADKLLAEHYSA